MTTPPARSTCPHCELEIFRERLGDGSTRWVHQADGAELCPPDGSGRQTVAEPGLSPRYQRRDHRRRRQGRRG